MLAKSEKLWILDRSVTVGEFDLWVFSNDQIWPTFENTLKIQKKSFLGPFDNPCFIFTRPPPWWINRHTVLCSACFDLSDVTANLTAVCTILQAKWIIWILNHTLLLLSTWLTEGTVSLKTNSSKIYIYSENFPSLPAAACFYIGRSARRILIKWSPLAHSLARGIGFRLKLAIRLNLLPQLRGSKSAHNSASANTD